MSLTHCGMCGTPLVGDADEHLHPRLRCPACAWSWYDPPVPVTLAVGATCYLLLLVCTRRLAAG